jgi:hypothetical protein
MKEVELEPTVAMLLKGADHDGKIIGYFAGEEDPDHAVDLGR